MGRVAEDPLKRYLAKVDKRSPEECWLWTAACFDNGYGAFRLGNKQLRAHRFGFQALVGPIPNGQNVCHTCDNPPCQNPAHWFLGGHGDNARDRQAKGRGAVGARNGGRIVAKLTDSEVRQVRLLALDGLTQREIGERFSLTQSEVSEILLRKTWAYTDHDLAVRSNNRHYKVTREVVDGVLAAYVPGSVRMQDLADRYQISRRTVSMILHGWQPQRTASH